MIATKPKHFFSPTMIFPSNSMISIQEITRGYRILERDIEVWVSEGWFPEYTWHKGKRVWDGNKFNEFAAGSMLPQYKLNQLKKKDTSSDFLLVLTVASAALILATIF